MPFSRVFVFLWLALLVDSAAARLHYSAQLAVDARRLFVSLCTDEPLTAGMLVSARSDAAEYLSDLAGDGASPPQLTRHGIQHAVVAAGECLRYTVDVYAAAQSDGYQLSWRAGEYVMVPMQLWLWRPQRIPPNSSLQMRLPQGWNASLPFAGDGLRYQLVHTPADWDATTVFGRLREHRIAVVGGELRVAVLPPAVAEQRRRLHAWAEQNAQTLLAGSGRLPLTSVQVVVVPLPGVATAVPWGQVTRGGGSALKLFVGLDASEEALRDDWTLAHELSHLLHPYLRTRGRWLSEGLASYYQNVLRARSGALTPQQAWNKLDAGFARGRAEPNQRKQSLSAAALSSYRSTMRVYWSGAAFWLEAELALRQRSGTDLAEALDVFARRHLPSDRQWQPERFVAELDAIAGMDVFVPLFDRYQRGTDFPALAATYRQLGLGEDVGRMALNDAAPAARIRDAIMQRSSALGPLAKLSADGDELKASSPDARPVRWRHRRPIGALAAGTSRQPSAETPSNNSSHHDRCAK
ncbi:MAG: M61 family metallopeptidase [Pseudomarimonas sp.]